MLLNSEQMKRLKRVDVSKDAEKTKERVKQDFGSASASTKRAIAESVGQGLNSLYRIYKEGNMTVRVALGFAHEFNVSPFYYTGEIDEKVPCTDELVKRFLEVNGYGNIADEVFGKSPKRQKRAYNRKKPKAEVKTKAKAGKKAKAEAPVEAAIEAAAAAPAEIAAVIPAKQRYDLAEKEAVYLLKALFIRAKGGGKAAESLDAVKQFLLS